MNSYTCVFQGFYLDFKNSFKHPSPHAPSMYFLKLCPYKFWRAIKGGEREGGVQSTQTFKKYHWNKKKNAVAVSISVQPVTYVINDTGCRSTWPKNKNKTDNLLPNEEELHHVANQATNKSANATWGDLSEKMTMFC